MVQLPEIQLLVLSTGQCLSSNLKLAYSTAREEIICSNVAVLVKDRNLPAVKRSQSQNTSFVCSKSKQGISWDNTCSTTNTRSGTITMEVYTYQVPILWYWSAAWSFVNIKPLYLVYFIFLDLPRSFAIRMRRRSSLTFDGIGSKSGAVQMEVPLRKRGWIRLILAVLEFVGNARGRSRNLASMRSSRSVS